MDHGERLGMNGIFDQLAPWVPRSLVSPEVMEGIRRLNGHLPAGLSTVGGLECRLTGEAPFAGWILGVNAANGGREALAGDLSGGAFPGTFLADDRWGHLYGFVRDWADPASPLFESVEDIWLEFDADVIHLPVPIPGVFFNTRKAPSALLSRVQRSSLSETDGESLDRCLQEIPEGGAVPFVAQMMSRERAGIRLILSMDPAEVQGYLHRIGWAGAEDEACGLLHDLAPRVDEIFLHIDVAHGVVPRLGLECILHRKQPRIEPRWSSFLQHLVELGLCSESSLEALLSWPGHDRGVLPGEVMPSYLLRGISHVKIVSTAGQPLVTKGYLGFRRLDEDQYPEFQGSPGPQEAS